MGCGGSSPVDNLDVGDGEAKQLKMILAKSKTVSVKDELKALMAMQKAWNITAWEGKLHADATQLPKLPGVKLTDLSGFDQHATDHVVSIDFNKKKLNGGRLDAVPWQHLKMLCTLNLDSCGLAGPVPESLSSCGMLRELFGPAAPTRELCLRMPAPRDPFLRHAPNLMTIRARASTSFICRILQKNNLSGNVPATFPWPKSLKMLVLDKNPDLAGTISKALVLQCERITFGKCKDKFKNYQTREVNEEYMKGPYLVGFSFSSQDLNMLLLNRAQLPTALLLVRLSTSQTHAILPHCVTALCYCHCVTLAAGGRLGIKDENIVDVPAPKIGASGQKFVPWQEAWLTPLEKWRDRNIYVYPTAGSRTAGEDFRSKFENRWLYEDHEGNIKRDSMDLGFRIECKKNGTPHTFNQRCDCGERAFSLLDWERRQFMRLCKSNNLKLKATNGEGGVEDPPIWYLKGSPTNLPPEEGGSLAGLLEGPKQMRVDGTKPPPSVQEVQKAFTKAMQNGTDLSRMANAVAMAEEAGLAPWIELGKTHIAYYEGCMNMEQGTMSEDEAVKLMEAYEMAKIKVAESGQFLGD